MTRRTSQRNRRGAAGFVLVLALIGTAWILRGVTGVPDSDPPGTRRDGNQEVGLAPPAQLHEPTPVTTAPGSNAETPTHGTAPEPGTARAESHGKDGIRPVPLPLDVSIPRTRSTWPNVRVDQALYAPEETSIVIDPLDPNRIVAVAQGAGCYYFRSDDGGVTWTEGAIEDPYDLGDPAITMDAAGNAYYAYIGTFSHSGIFVTKSTDRGVTWQPGTPVIEHDSGAPFEDKEYPVCDRTDGPYAGSVYLAWTQFDAYGSSNPADSTRILFSYSRDGATSFAEPIRISDEGGDCIDRDDTVEGAVAAVGPDGTVYLAWAGPRGIEFDRSTDGGATWGADRFLTDIPGGWDFAVSGIYRCNGLPQTLTDISDGPYSGRVYVLWSDQRNGDTDLFLIHSDDGGFEWSSPLRINGDPIGNGRDQFFPWADVDPVTGHLYVVFYDRRETEGNATEVWLGISADGGATFSEQVVSQSPFTPNSSVFFGDYIGIAARNGRVRPFWMRLDGNQMSAWTALVDFDPSSAPGPVATPPRTGTRLTALPNPARTETRIFAWSGVDDRAWADGPLRIFAADGRLVRTYPNAPEPGGESFVSWDLRDERGNAVPSGSYWLRAPDGGRARIVVTR